MIPMHGMNEAGHPENGWVTKRTLGPPQCGWAGASLTRISAQAPAGT